MLQNTFAQMDFNPFLIIPGLLFVFSLPVILIGLLLHYQIIPNRLKAKRKKQGLCAKCGYDLQNGQDMCPECGTLKEL